MYVFQCVVISTHAANLVWTCVTVTAHNGVKGDCYFTGCDSLLSHSTMQDAHLAHRIFPFSCVQPRQVVAHLRNLDPPATGTAL